jgi:import inner membrane translocase subunit TIM54
MNEHASLKDLQKAHNGSKPDLKADPKPAKPLKPPNPIYKYMGLGENFRPRLPSRNWMIFLSITGSFTAAVIYDKRETRRAQRKWCKLVEHMAKEPLDPLSMPRRLTVFLEGPPSDGLRIAQDHFKEYVKPMLVASGLDWEFIQGRKEGDIRAELAEKIRNSRLSPDERGNEDAVAEVRRKGGIKEFDGPRGDIVIGRHTWKEYVRGVHEGWLGPLTEPPSPATEAAAEEAGLQESEDKAPVMETLPGITLLSEPREAVPEDKTEESAATAANEKGKKPPQPKPFISTSAYKLAPTPPELPSEFDPSQPISFPHILGFLNTPKRIYRFLHRRVLADSIGRETAAIILSTYRPYHSTSNNSSLSSFTNDSEQIAQNPDQEEVLEGTEQQTALFEEEKEWHKKTRERVDGEGERTWLDTVVLDPRIASRMRRAELTPQDEARAKSIVILEEEVEGWIKGGIRSMYREGVKYFGSRKEKKPLIDDVVE